MHRFLSHRYVRFGLVGAMVTLFFMGLNAAFARGFGMSPHLAFLAAYPPALVMHFGLNKMWTFRDRRKTSPMHLGRYLVSVGVTFLIQWPIFLALQGRWNLPGWVAAGAANGLQMVASYLLLRFGVFNDPAKAGAL
jgi:putative flippase GtrA